MESIRSLLIPAALVTWLALTPGPIAQNPTPDPAAPPAATERTEQEQPTRRPRRRGRRPQFTVIEAGTVHPVNGPPIRNGLVVISRDKILAVGQQGKLDLPPNTKVFKFPDGHVYPGLIDASTDAFTDASLRADRSLNGGSKLSDALLWSGARADRLVEHGITTAYVNVRSSAQLPGQGAIVRPRKDGYELWEDLEQAALQMSLAQGTGASHPLSRQSALAGAGKVFEGLDKYREAQEKYEKDLEKYEEDFAKYLEHHAKKNGKDKKKADGADKDGKDAKADDKKPAEAGKEAAEEQPAERRRGRRRRGGNAADEQAMTAEAFEAALRTLMALVPEQQAPPAIVEAQDPKKPQGKPAPAGKPGGEKGGKADDKKKDDGPKRPKYPKKPAEDPQKEALLKVLDGELPLRVAVERRDEVQAALAMQLEHEIPLLVLERAFDADHLVGTIAEQGATLVLTGLLPTSLGSKSNKRNPFADCDPAALTSKLNAQGVPFAIATGSSRLASLLPMMAATAVGEGLPAEAALRAITLTPAEILGIAEETGSLATQKLADVLVTDRPLFEADSRVMLVLAKGRVEYEAK